MRRKSTGKLRFSNQAKVLNSFSNPLLLFLFSALALPSEGAAPVIPDERDGRVLEALLLHLLHDPKFEMTRVPTNEWVIVPVIVLHDRTPEKTGYLRREQMRSDTRNHTLPSEAEEDLRQRNSPADAKPDNYDCVTAYYTNLTLRSRIVIADLSKIASAAARPRSSDLALQRAYPNARGFVYAYLPGYSKDAKQAIVRAGVGPSAHGAMLTALLEKNGEKWTVKWYHVARYA
jgi:hypothetical protein